MADTEATRVALVTGANKGIGRAIASRLGREGITVFVGARDVGRGHVAADQMRAEGIDARFVQLDITDAASVDAAAEAVTADAGRLDILVNNAGIALEMPTSVPSTTTADTMRATYETNVFGLVTVTNAFLPLLLAAPAGRIVNLSSEVGSAAIWSDKTTPMAMFAPQVPAYGTSKAAINALTVAYAHELRSTPVKVNAVSPGHIGTDINHFAGPGTPEQGADVVVPYALLHADGPTGGFFGEHGPVPW